MSGYQFALDTTHEIKQLTKEHLSQFGVTDIAYNYAKNSGKRYLLCSNENILKLCFGKNKQTPKEKWPSTVRIKRHDWHTTEMLLSQVPEKAANFIKEKKASIATNTNIHTLITVNHHTGNDLEYIEFWTNNAKDKHKILSHIEELQQFLFLFKDKTRELRKLLTKKPILQPNEVVLYENKQTENSPIKAISRYYLNDDKNCYLTERETQCISLLFQCRSAKEIGLALGLSQRTVESYIRTVKEKFHCSKQSELFDVMQVLGFKANSVIA